MKKIAVVGSGISGLAAAYYLSRKHLVFLFEKLDRLGGHTHTVEVESSRGKIPVDTGFIVYNDRTYPNLVRLLDELRIERKASDMSFAVSCRRTGFEYSSRGPRGYFAQSSNLFRPAHYRLLLEILRFNREAPRLLDEPGAEEISLGDYLDREGFAGELIGRYLVPMASAIWSMSPGDIRSFPALTLVRFFHNHGLLGINTHPQWRVLSDGSSSYIGPITAPYRERIFLGSTIQSIRRTSAGVSLVFGERPSMDFDEVVLACHGDEVLPLLEAPTDVERDILGAFRTSRNEVCLHTDSSLLPRRSAARASWNYNLDLGGEKAVTLTYHMNRLQSLAVPEDYCVSLNAEEQINRAKILRRIVYHHPQYSKAAITAQSRWSEISGRNRTHFCGAYWLYGFHEDGLNSALRVARALEVE